MAFEYLQLVVQKFLNDTYRILDYKIIPAGTYDQVIRITQSFPALSIDKRKVQAFLDKDAEEAFNELKAKGMIDQKLKIKNLIYFEIITKTLLT